MNQQKLTTCRICGKEFWANQHRKYTCSPECARAWQNELKRLSRIKKDSAKHHPRNKAFQSFEHFQEWVATMINAETINKYSRRFE